MRTSRILALLVCLAMIAGQSAWAHSPRARVGLVFGPMWSPFWYPQPWPPYPPPLVVAPSPPPPPPVYIEQGQSETAPDMLWYYCRSVGGYYPAVGNCPDGWLPVLPEPAK